MNKYLKAVSLFLVCCFLFSACSSDKMYYDYDMTKYVSLGEYDKTVMRDSDEYDEYRQSFYRDTFGNELDAEVYVGALQKWDVTKLEYVIYCDGAEITETENVGIDITVGEKGFVIDGFENALIGATIGEEAVWETTLADDFYVSTIAGKEVEIHYLPYFATRGMEPTEPDAKKFGYDSLADYKKAEDDFAVSVALFNHIYDAAEIIEFPKYETEVMLEQIYDSYEKDGKTPEQLAAGYDWTMEELENTLLDVIQKSYKNMPRDLISFYVLQLFDQKLTEEDIENTRIEIIEEVGDDIKAAGYTELEVQRRAAYLKALDVLKTVAIVK